MSLYPDNGAASWDKLSLHHSGAKRLIRFASVSETYRVRAVHTGRPFTVLAVIVTVEDGGTLPIGLRYAYVPIASPRGRPVVLPTDADIIRNVSEGRGCLVRIPGGFALKGVNAEWSR